MKYEITFLPFASFVFILPDLSFIFVHPVEERSKKENLLPAIMFLISSIIKNILTA